MLAVAGHPTPELIHAFDAFFYPLALRNVLKRRHTLTRIAGKAAVPVGVLPSERLEEAAHVTALIALNRARASAKDFDPARGTAEDWVLRATAWAFQETARQITQSRRRLRLVPTEDEDLHRAVDQQRSAPDTYDVVEARERLRSVFSDLTQDEQQAVMLCRRDGYTHEQAAEIMFGDAARRKRIDRLLQSAAIKLRREPPTT